MNQRLETARMPASWPAGFGISPARISMNAQSDETGAPAPMDLPIDGVLDLHTFRPKDVKPLVLDYLEACRAQGILQVRIIHGKGIGQLRQTVHALLRKHPDVVGFAQASEPYGGWGATIVHLRPATRL